MTPYSRIIKKNIDTQYWTILSIDGTAVPPTTADLGTDEKAAVLGNRRWKESYITKKNIIWDFKMGGSIGVGGDEWWYWWMGGTAVYYAI